MATAITTTTFRMVSLLLAMGMKLLMSHKATPTTISAMTMLIRGIFSPSPMLFSSNPLPNRGQLAGTGLTKHPAPLNHSEHQHDQTEHQQDVNEPAGGVRGGHSQSPQNQQNQQIVQSIVFLLRD